jgi:ligand-binding sensor domain-containing protein/serine phosphatase RsbU (regulator of sigma subunit)
MKKRLRKIEKPFTKHMLLKHYRGIFRSSILAIILAFLFSACSQNTAEKDKTTSSPNKNAVPPVKNFITKPIIVLLDTCPSPSSLSVPKSGSLEEKTQTKNGIKTRKLTAPPIRAADFFVTMQNHNAEQGGLPLNIITCGYKDKTGNLWFGTDGAGISRYDGKSFTNYSAAQGLANNDILSITQDKKGNFWFGTYGGGVSRYNGKTFTNFNVAEGLANNIVKSILEDKKGNMWFGTYGGGVSCYDGKSFTSYTTVDGLANDVVRVIAEDKTGNIWFGTFGGGVSRYDGKSFTNYTVEQGLANNDVLSIVEDKRGNLWFGTSNGVSCYNGKSFTNYTTKEGLPNNVVKSILEDTKGNLWFGTSGGGVSCYNGEFFKTYTTAQGLVNNNVWSILEDETGHLWFGTNGGGISCYADNTFTNFTTLQGLANNTVWSIQEDSKGNLWFGTDGGGINKYIRSKPVNGKQASSFINYSTEQGLSNNTVSSIIEDKEGNIWFGTSGGVCKYDGDVFTNFTTEQGLSNNIVYCIMEDKDGNMWFGTDEGACKYTPPAKSKIDSKLFNDKPGGTFTTFTINQGLAGNIVRSIVQDKEGNVWLGTQGGGVSKYDGKYFTNYSTAQGLINNRVWCITEDETGNLWFGTNGGLSMLRNDKERLSATSDDFTLFKNFTIKNGLSNDIVTQILEDKLGNIIIGTNDGLTILTLRKNNSSNETTVPNYDCTVYNKSTGYPIKDVNTGQQAMYMDSKGVIWTGMGDRLLSFDYSSIHKNKNAPTVFIQSIKIDNENIPWYSLFKKNTSGKTIIKAVEWGNNSAFRNDSLFVPPNVIEEVNLYGNPLDETQRDTIRKQFSKIKFDSIIPFYPVPQNLILPYEHNSITFDFVAVEPAKPFLIKYQYLLEGYDKDWSPSTNKASATFGNIHEGNYTFKLKARNQDGIWSAPIIYTFKVLPPLYRTWWAYLGYLVAGIASIGAFIKWRERNLKKEKEIQEEKIKIRTQQLQNANEKITEQKKVVEGKNKDILDSIYYAKRIQDALLKEDENADSNLPEHFVLFKPKDIVSGDFYWVVEKKGYWYIAVVDCTGHGVPGAFMSMLGMAFLNDIISNETRPTPSEILDKLREKVVIELRQTGKTGESQDGMDVSLIRIHLKTKQLQWAGANSPLSLMRNGQLQEIKADKQPIGYYPGAKPFTNHIIELKTGESVYIFSDGYVDQFGGSRGKKFKHKQLRTLIQSIYQKPMIDQKEILDTTFKNWKGEYDQVDDICIIGFRV